MGFHLFVDYALSEPLFFVSVVVTVIVSIVLHELSHGWAALWQGDRTPIERGHMTANPVVHMGWLALVMLAVVGIAWGRMPVNPYRFRHRRWGEALVAAAGPLMNVILAGIALSIAGLWLRFASPGLAGDSPWRDNLLYFLQVFGRVNLVLFMFNLLPIPPLDGSRILAGFVEPYARLIDNPDRRGVMVVLFVVVFLGAGYLFAFAAEASNVYTGWVAGW